MSGVNHRTLFVEVDPRYGFSRHRIYDWALVNTNVGDCAELGPPLQRGLALGQGLADWTHDDDMSRVDKFEYMDSDRVQSVAFKGLHGGHLLPRDSR